MPDVDYLLAFSQPRSRHGRKAVPSGRRLPRTSHGLDRLVEQVANTYFARYVTNLRTLYGDKAVQTMMSMALRRAARTRRAMTRG